MYLENWVETKLGSLVNRLAYHQIKLHQYKVSDIGLRAHVMEFHTAKWLMSCILVDVVSRL